MRLLSVAVQYTTIRAYYYLLYFLQYAHFTNYAHIYILRYELLYNMRILPITLYNTRILPISLYNKRMLLLRYSMYILQYAHITNYAHIYITYYQLLNNMRILPITLQYAHFTNYTTICAYYQLHYSTRILPITLQ